ncbi:MAG: hypothetical protein WDO73_29025 [Ignavibacteriota bacterium]
MSAYSLQQQLAAARGAYERVVGQVAASRGNGSAVGSDRFYGQASEMLEQIARCLADAYNVESAMDGYQGLPTGIQLRELDRVWEEGVAAVAGLNRLVEETGLGPVPVPVR